ncbi:ParB N-terminal domain-containing protein [Parvularcula sp. ZS-1/3]|uniref:ParB N-terminal domain-containing protein n=1 Tax=Parvularcula mediterranea TaxID=2732508 RepID=A0A7Y3RNU3_9PROT|nr:ParB/RepB/Spo0J family partition protein [Parvularcula mediterranea]NNU17534.1 ParB N-terminal domain-containing protein [Parvularcula mediterranea]
MTDFITHPLKSLVIAEENARAEAEPDQGIAQLANLIAEEGLQQPLCGYAKGKTQVAVYDGRRRLLALKQLAKEHRLPSGCTDGVPVRLGSKEQARQASLSAGLSHRGFHPAEEYRQFARLLEDGKTVPEIARTYSVAEREVEKRLKLARLAPPIFDAFARDAITIEQAQAFALTDDHDRQVALLEPHGFDISAHAIRRHLTEGETPATDKRARFVGLEAYEAAGGKVRRDLFGEDGDTLADNGLLTRLAEKKLQEIAEEVRGEGWSWVLAMVAFDPALHQTCYRVHPQKHEVTGEAKEEQGRLVARLKALLDGPEGTEPEEHDLSSEEWEEVEAIEARMDEIDRAHTGFTDDDRARGGVVVHLDHKGEPKIVRGLVRREEKKAETKPDKPSVPHSVHKRCTEIVTQALARDVAANPAEAGILLTAVLARSAFSHWSLQGVKLAISGFHPSEGSELPVSHALAERQEHFAERLGDSLAETVAMVQGLTEDERRELRAFCLAPSLDFTEARSDQPDHGARRTAALIAERFGSDLRQHWTPDEAYFQKLSRPALADALREMGSRETGLESCKKADLVPMAVRRAKSSGWLPESVRFAEATASEETLTDQQHEAALKAA